MDNTILKKLKEMFAAEGENFYKDVEKFKQILEQNKALFNSRIEINILTILALIDIPQKICSFKNFDEREKSRLTDELNEEFAIERQWAKWGINVWSSILESNYGVAGEVIKSGIILKEIDQSSKTTIQTTTITGKGSGLIKFENKEIESIIRKKLHKMANDDIYKNELKTIKEMTFLLNSSNSMQGQKSIEWLTYFTGLVNLTLVNGNLSDITPVSELVNLENLWLYNNNIEDISSIANLKKLKKLYLDKNRIFDISKLSSLEGLQELRIEHNFIRDISPLKALNKLEDLRMGYNYISDLTPLMGMSKLHFLDITQNNVRDINPLRSLRNLAYLNVANNAFDKDDIEVITKILYNTAVTI